MNRSMKYELSVAKKLKVILFSILVCNFAFGNSSAVITGTIEMWVRNTCQPTPETSCPDIGYLDVITISNDTGYVCSVEKWCYH